MTYDVKSGKTKAIRSKEGAFDYRFFPDPDLPVIYLYNYHDIDFFFLTRV